jgi:hypothetical protein
MVTFNASRKALCLSLATGAGRAVNGRDRMFPSFFAAEDGIPASLAAVVQTLYQELPEREATTWCQRFVQAVPVGVDISSVWCRLAFYILMNPDDGMGMLIQRDDQLQGVSAVSALLLENCQDAQRWDEAAQLANKGSQRGPDGNRRLDANETRIKLGCDAARVASYIARSFADPDVAAEAVKWAPWCYREQKYAQLMQDVHDETVADERGMVNVGVALWNCGQWIRKSDECTGIADKDRLAGYVRYSRLLISYLHDLETGGWRGACNRVKRSLRGQYRMAA